MKRLAVAILSLALPFTAQAATDLSISVVDSPDPVQGGATLTYFITVINHGPEEANRVKVKTGSRDAFVISITTSQGFCQTFTSFGQVLSCEVGVLPVGVSANVTLVVVAPDNFGNTPLPHNANVGSFAFEGDQGPALPDTNESNNSVNTLTDIFLTPSQMCAVEGGELIFDGGRCCEPGVDEGCNGLPVEPAKKKFSCRTSGCVVPIECNIETQCDVAVNLSVNVNSIKGRAATRRLRFASAFASIPSSQTQTIRPGLTKRGKRLVRKNRNKLVTGVMTISNTATGERFSRTRVKIRLR